MTNYYRLPEPEKWWCNTHTREATHVCYNHGLMQASVCCDPQLGGILKSCDCVPMDRTSEMKKPKEHTWKTFKEWSDAGYKIIKGSKATRFDAPKFNEEQVVKMPKSYGDCYEFPDTRDDDYGCWPGDPNDYGNS